MSFTRFEKTSLTKADFVSMGIMVGEKYPLGCLIIRLSEGHKALFPDRVHVAFGQGTDFGKIQLSPAKEGPEARALTKATGRGVQWSIRVFGITAPDSEKVRAIKCHKVVVDRQASSLTVEVPERIFEWLDVEDKDDGT